MPISVMCALMLAVSLVGGMFAKAFRGAVQRLVFFAVLAAVILLHDVSARFSAEFDMNLASVVLLGASVPFIILNKCGAGTLLKAMLASLVLCFCTLALTAFLEPDAAALAFGLVSVAMMLTTKGEPAFMLGCTLAPVLASVLQMLARLLLSGYGYLELDAACADLQMIALAFNLYALELRESNIASRLPLRHT